MIGPSYQSQLVNLLYRGDPVQTETRISYQTFRFRHHCGIEEGILGDFLAFLMQLPADFHDTRQIDWRRKVMNSQHFGSDPADIRIWIRINPEIRIQIPDQWPLLVAQRL